MWQPIIGKSSGLRIRGVRKVIRSSRYVRWTIRLSAVDQTALGHCNWTLPGQACTQNRPLAQTSGLEHANMKQILKCLQEMNHILHLFISGLAYCYHSVCSTGNLYKALFIERHTKRNSGIIDSRYTQINTGKHY